MIIRHASGRTHYPDPQGHFRDAVTGRVTWFALACGLISAASVSTLERDTFRVTCDACAAYKGLGKVR